MRLGFLLVAVVLCGVCYGIPTETVTSTTSVATASASSTGGSTSTKAAPAASSSGSSSATAGAGGLQGDFDEDDDDDDEPQISGDTLGLPLSSALLLSSHHGHHVCLPDVVAFSLFGNRGYPLGTLFPYHHSSPQRLQQELMLLKAFTKAGQHVWKTIASGHGKHPYQDLGSLAKVAGAISSGVNTFAGKGGHGSGGITNGIASGLSSAAQHVTAAVH